MISIDIKIYQGKAWRLVTPLNTQCIDNLAESWKLTCLTGHGMSWKPFFRLKSKNNIHMNLPRDLLIFTYRNLNKIRKVSKGRVILKCKYIRFFFTDLINYSKLTTFQFLNAIFSITTYIRVSIRFLIQFQ